jgi:hypothetical protein
MQGKAGYAFADGYYMRDGCHREMVELIVTAFNNHGAYANLTGLLRLGPHLLVQDGVVKVMTRDDRNRARVVAREFPSPPSREKLEIAIAEAMGEKRRLFTLDTVHMEPGAWQSWTLTNLMVGGGEG